MKIIIKITCRLHKTFVESQHPEWTKERVQLEQHKKFVDWFRDHVSICDQLFYVNTYMNLLLQKF